jgi:hypothetical protein
MERRNDTYFRRGIQIKRRKEGKGMIERKKNE